MGTPSEVSDDAAISTRAIKSPRHISGTYPHSSTNARTAEFKRGRRGRTGSISTDESVVVVGQYKREGISTDRFTKASEVISIARYSSWAGTKLSISTKESKTPTSPNPTINTIATSSTTARAERSLYVPFLPKLLRVKGNSGEEQLRDSMDGTKETTTQDIKPKLEDYSSDMDFEDEATVQEAQQGRLRRPNLLQHTSSTVVELKEMLRTTGPASTENSPGPSGRKLRKLLGEDLKSSNRLNSKRATVVGNPISQDTDSLTISQKAKDADPGPSEPTTWQSSVPLQMDGLRSHPIQRSATMPAPKRKVDFWPPLGVDIKPEHRFLRQSIVSTPYPLRYQERGVIVSKPRIHDRLESTLTLVLSIQRATKVPVVKTIVLPNKQTPTDWLDKRDPNAIEATNDAFDDEKLFRLIRAEYKNMRGYLRNALSARHIESLNLISYGELSSLAEHNRSPLRESFRVQDGIFAGPQLLRLFRTPHLGRNSHKWVHWVTGLPENSSNNQPPNDNNDDDDENRALELVEGLSVWRIISALVAVAISSLLATLLWIFLGVDTENIALATGNDSFAQASPPVGLGGGFGRGFRGAGGRVQGGALLGALVLMLGWTGVGAWVLLSWLD